MPWPEFVQLIKGIDPETPLGRIVSIRAEDDKDMLKLFTKEQRRIRHEWRSKHAKKMSKEELNSALAQFQAALVAMAGGTNGKT